MCCWNLIHTGGYLDQITQKPMLSGANGALHDWGSAGAQEPHGASPQLCRALAHRPPWPLCWNCCRTSLGSKENELTWLSLKVTRITKVWMVCRARTRSVIATGVSQIEQLRISGYLKMRILLSSFHRKSLCSVTAGVVLGLGKISVSWPGPENKKKILARTAKQHQLKPHLRS